LTASSDHTCKQVAQNSCSFKFRVVVMIERAPTHITTLTTTTLATNTTKIQERFLVDFEPSWLIIAPMVAVRESFNFQHQAEDGPEFLTEILRPIMPALLKSVYTFMPIFDNLLCLYKNLLRQIRNQLLLLLETRL